MTKTRSIAIELLKATGQKTDKKSVDLVQRVLFHLTLKEESVFELIYSWGQQTSDSGRHEVIDSLRYKLEVYASQLTEEDHLEESDENNMILEANLFNLKG